jgi:sensor histidine kinase YesM
MKESKRLFIHIVSWVSILLFFLFIGGHGFQIKHESIIVVIYFGVINIAVFYFNYLYLLPEFLSTKKYFLFFLSILLLVLITGFVKYALAVYYKEIILIKSHPKEFLSFGEYYLRTIFASIFFLFLSSGLRFSRDWFVNEKLVADLEKEKLQAELALLRSQVNPHFLFNSLNNIYSLSYQKSEKAPEAILKLSEIMRYMLNESYETVVSLAKEIRYIKNYIELQELRFPAGSYIDFQIICKECEKQFIAPLILIAFVENAFKHGDATDSLHPIRINFTITGNQLTLRIENKKNSTQNKDASSGIGMNNVKRRLDLLYPAKYKLEITDSSTYYNSELSLVL